MQKADLIKIVSARTGINSRDVSHSLEFAMDEIVKTVQNGGSVFIRGFGTFTQKKRATKKARNISQGTFLIVPEHHIPYFKPAPNFRERVKKL